MLVSDGAARETFVVGPRKTAHHCTDFLCLIVFGVSILALFVVAGVGYHEGNPEALQQFVSGTDFQGNLCGKDDAVKKFKFTYYALQDGATVPTTTDELRSMLLPVCTDECPPSNLDGIMVAVPRSPDRCPDYAVSGNRCTQYSAGTVLRVANYCISEDAFDVGVNIGAWVQDVKQAGWIMSISPLIALVFGFAFLGVVYHCGSLIIWIAMIGIVVGPAISGGFIFANAQSQANGQVADSNLSPGTQKDIAYGLFITSGVLLICMLCMCKTLNQAGQVIKSASEFLSDVPSQMLQPLLFGALALGILALNLIIGVQVASMNADTPTAEECQAQLADGHPFCVQWNGSSQVWAVIFVIVMAFWITSFLLALSHYGTAFAVSEWYFATPNEEGRRHPLGNALGCCDFKLSFRGIGSGLLNHAGSLAMGSIVITFCKIIRVCLGWVKTTNHANPNLCTKCLACITACIVSCMTRFIEFISEHAYVEVALTGHGFCASAVRAMHMAVEHPGLFTLVGRVAISMEVLGMAVCSTCTMLIVAVLLNWFPPEGLSSPTAPLTGAAIVGLVIGEITMHPLVTAARSSLHCFVLDEEQSKEAGVQTARHAPHGVAAIAQEGRTSVVVLG